MLAGVYFLFTINFVQIKCNYIMNNINRDNAYFFETYSTGCSQMIHLILIPYVSH